MTKAPLKSPQGNKLKLYTVLISGYNGIFQFMYDVHMSVAYTPEEAIADTKAALNKQNSSQQFTYEVKKTVDMVEFLKFLQDNIEAEVWGQPIPVFKKQPKYVSAEAEKFLDQIIDAAQALEPEETERRILIKSLNKIKNLYVKNPSLSRSRITQNI